MLPQQQNPKYETLEDIEKQVTVERLEVFQGNRTHAAQSLGISVRTLQRKIEAWKLSPRCSKCGCAAPEEPTQK